MNHRIWSNGVYHDKSFKGRRKNGRKRGYHNSYRGEVNLDGQRIRKRFHTREAAQDWIDTMKLIWSSR